VTSWLSAEWFDQVRVMAAALPDRPGLTARIQEQITGGPDGDLSCYWEVEDGHPTAAAAGTIDDADVILTLSWSDAAAVHTGALDPSVAFMQGRMKVTGSMDVTLALLPVAREPDALELWRQVAAITDF
jgi:putative sterol carrier protein